MRTHKLKLSTSQRPYSSKRHRLTSRPLGIPTINLRWSDDPLRVIMGIPNEQEVLNGLYLLVPNEGLADATAKSAKLKQILSMLLELWNHLSGDVSSKMLGPVYIVIRGGGAFFRLSSDQIVLRNLAHAHPAIPFICTTCRLCGTAGNTLVETAWYYATHG